MDSITQPITNASNGFVSFVNSNSIIAKISFLLFVLFIFIILLQISITFLSWIFLPSGSPRVINGMVPGNQMLIIPQDPSIVGAKTINRSINASDGIEFTWSVWIFVNNIETDNKYHHVFHKGDDSMDENSISQTNAPGLYLNPNTNTLTVIMNTYDVINEQAVIPDIPMNKWINVIIRVKNRDLDIYINGTITKSVQLLGVPKQNYGPVYIAQNGGFDGFISNLWYYNHAMGISEIESLVRKGPNTKMVGNSAIGLKNPDYLSLRWFFNSNDNVHDQFN